MLPLTKLPLETSGYIYGIELDDHFKRRLLELGLIKNTKIEVIHNSNGGETLALSVRGTVIALRKEDAEKIWIAAETADGGQCVEFMCPCGEPKHREKHGF